ncbi:Retrovirus-related Pol Polyprotein, partial [Phytophthora palmivora]
MTRFVRKTPNTQYMFTFAQGSKHSNTHIGTIKLYLCGPKGIKPFLFDNIAMAPHATSSILSEFWLRRSGYQIIGSLSGKFKFVLFDNELVFIAKAINGAYYVQNKTLLERQVLCSAVKTQPCKPLELPESGRLETTLQEWHVKLGHINKDTLIDMLSMKLVGGLPTMSASGLRKIPFFCSTCAEMKKRRMSYRNTKGSRDEQPISTIHMDTNGPMKTMGVYGSQGTIKYFLSIIDDNTSWRWTYVLRSKKEVFEKVEELLLQLELHDSSDQIRLGNEFVNAAFKNFCKGKGIVFQTSNAYSPEENGAAERDHQSKLDRVRCALKDADMAHKWWPEALMYMTYVQNRTPMRRLGYKTPYEMVNGKPPNVKELPVWGSVCFAHIPAALRKDKKLSARAVKCRFLGISEDTKGCRLWDTYNNQHRRSQDVLSDTFN